MHALRTTNRFYRLPAWVHWPVATLMFGIGVAPWFAAFYWPYVLFLSPVLLSWHLFGTTPLMTLTGIYRSFSPGLFGLRLGPRVIDLHNGSLFDDLFAERTSPVRSPRREALIDLFRGLLAAADDVRDGSIPPDVKIRGALTFFNERSAEKLGFTVEKLNLLDAIGAIMGLFDRTIRLSLRRGRLSFPHFSDFKLKSTTGEELVSNMGNIERLVARLEGAPDRGSSQGGPASLAQEPM